RPRHVGDYGVESALEAAARHPHRVSARHDRQHDLRGRGSSAYGYGAAVPVLLRVNEQTQQTSKEQTSKRTNGSRGCTLLLVAFRLFACLFVCWFAVPMAIESLSAVTLAVSDMARSVRFYTTLG